MDINAIGKLKCLEKLRLELHQDDLLAIGGAQPQFLNLKAIGLLPKLHLLDLSCQEHSSLTFTQLKQLLWAAPLRTLRMHCYNYFVDESENAAR